MRRIVIAFAYAAIAILAGCGTEMPSYPDGGAVVKVAIADTSGLLPGGTPGVPLYLDSAEVSLQSTTHEFYEIAVTDPDGVAAFVSMVAGSYTLFARKEYLIENNKKVFTGNSEVFINTTQLISDTILVNLIAASDLMINEVFYCGSDYSSFYFYDQYVELYNAADDTLYLDGIILTRQAQIRYPDQEEVDFVRAIYAFQFPGTPVTGRQYPIAPKQFIVIAADAIDHTLYCSRSVDLSIADWECFNPLGSDYDVPDVPNITSIHPTKGTDYLINLVHNAAVIASGEEYYFDEYEPGKLHIILPIYTIIDGVEWASSTSSTKELTARVDAGFAGLGCPKYSGQSTERRELGLDTNDSTFDFLLTPKATPGYSYFD
jgi:hypothetical protein